MDKINVSELLKGCPSGLELDCTCADNVIFDKIIEYEQIKCVIGECRDPLILDKYGRLLHICCPKCVIFPKGKTTWEGFQRPFNDGDILVYKHKSNNVKYTFIYKRRINMHYLLQYCGWFQNKPYLSEQFNAKERIPLYENDDIKFATEEEKEKLFQAIKERGYRWNPETKTLEKLVEPKFKVGDTITNGKTSITIGYIDNEYYYEISRNIANRLFIKFQDEWSLISEKFPNKFNINTLVPFESKVLIRDNVKEKWHPGIWGYYDNDTDLTYPYKLIGVIARYCIPYEGNEHLLGTTYDCNEYFKTWK